MGKSSAPEPPDPRETSAAQTGTNVGTAIANAFLGNVNQRTPNGNLTYNQTGSYTYNDPYTGESYQIPQFTVTQQLSPAQQRLQNTNQQTQQNLAELGRDQSSRLQGLLGRPMDLSGLPEGANPADINLPTYQRFTGGPDLQTELADVGGPDRDVGPIDFSQDRQRVEDALFARLNPQLEQDRQALDTRLAQQGIMPGSEAYNRAIDEANRHKTDARLGAILSAGQEQSRLADLAFNQFGLENQAQQQAFQQGLVGAQFGNNALQQEFANQQATTGANNELERQRLADEMAQQQAQQSARQAALQEAYAKRSAPINEITALLSGSQVSQPNFVGTSMPQISPTNNAGIIQQDYQNRLGQWKQKQQSSAGFLNGLFGLGTSFFLG